MNRTNILLKHSIISSCKRLFSTTAKSNGTPSFLKDYTKLFVESRITEKIIPRSFENGD